MDKLLASQQDLNISMFDLENNDDVLVDDGPNALAYFSKKTPLRVTQQTLAELKIKMQGLKNRNLRLCLHSSPEAAFHDMIIFERKGKYYRPHKHSDKGETLYILEGKSGIFAFTDDGKVVDACVLEPGKTLMYKIRPGMYHAIMPITDMVIYHECKLGPFKKLGDSIYPSWAPDGSDQEEAQRYMDDLLKRLDK